MRDPRAHNPGVNAAIADPPPDMKLKPPMRGEVDHRPVEDGMRRGSTMVIPRVGNWKKPNSLQAEKVGNKFSKGDLLKGKNPNY